MIARDCRDVRAGLPAYLDGDLDPTAAGETRAHLERCAACRAELELIRVTVGALRRLPEVPPPATLLAGVRARLRPEPWYKSLFDRRQWLAGLPAGALATLIVIVGVALFQSRHPGGERVAERSVLPPAAAPGMPDRDEQAAAPREAKMRDAAKIVRQAPERPAMPGAPAPPPPPSAAPLPGKDAAKRPIAEDAGASGARGRIDAADRDAGGGASPVAADSAAPSPSAEREAKRATDTYATTSPTPPTEREAALAAGTTSEMPLTRRDVGAAAANAPEMPLKKEALFRDGAAAGGEATREESRLQQPREPAAAMPRASLAAKAKQDAAPAAAPRAQLADAVESPLRIVCLLTPPGGTPDELEHILEHEAVGKVVVVELDRQALREASAAGRGFPGRSGEPARGWTAMTRVPAASLGRLLAALGRQPGVTLLEAPDLTRARGDSGAEVAVQLTILE